MANSSFFKNTGTSTQIQGSANASAAAALASEQAALVSENAAQTSETNSAASAAAALASKNAAATSAASANSDASAASISATASQTAATTSSANVALTSADATQTAADRVQTGLDRIATNADAVQTAADRVQTGLDVTSSSASAAAALSSRNASATSETNAAASAASSSADATATAADRVQTGLDRTATNADAIATAADRVQTGLDATASANSASAANTSATAAAASQVSAASSAASAAAVFNDFEDRYYGPHASDSAAQTHVTGLGLTVDQGDLYFNSTANEMRVYDGGSWIAASSAGGASLINYHYTATAAQTTFSGSDDNSRTLSYTVDNLIVTRNGVVLEDGTDYTATSGTSIVLASAASAGDEINIVAFKSFTTADMVSATNGGAFQGNVDFAAGADVTGNITVTGTVDGRDIATDGTKLDGIEALADVTDATNVAAAGALMTTGGSVTGNVTFGDNDKAIFGAGSDLQIYHDGADSYMTESGTGSLYIGADSTIALTDAAVTQNKAQFITGGAVNLFHNNAQKFATTATGIGVTGHIDVNTSGNRAKLGYDSNNVYIGSTSGTGQIHFKNNIGSNDAPHSSGDTKMVITDSGVDVTGTVTADGLTVDGPATVNNADLLLNGGSPEIIFQTGASHYNWMIAAQENVSNALEISSGSQDGDYSNDTWTPRLVVKSDGSVGIGNSDPQHKFHITHSGTGAIPTDYQMGATSPNDNYQGIHNNNNSATFSGLALETRTSGASRWLIANEWKNTYLGDLVFRNRNAALTSQESMRIDSSGRVTMPYQPCFYAYKSNGDISSTTPVVYVFNNSIVNVGNHYSTSTGRYTAGVAGNYHFSCQILNRSTTGGGRIHFYKNGSPYFTVGTATSATYYSISGEATQGASAVIYLAAGDYVEIKVWNTNGDFYGSGNCHNSFSGFLIG